ncbi:helix-turn-helix domain-containing protein [Parendozoicomonas sp. Alg238-R29]|uniref:winged helix-turn-helix transcriptional regulator n=1 Tax=Parendozoicomonas sp. Alg238-R29 TaxID=2993446 RepID=UPI00248EC997|nr:helix-turn-helix domain-containing protein [Parendozoicomonas sp. Alg238-R29]
MSSQSCSIARSVAIFGDRWTLLILREIFVKVCRFSELQATLGITRHRLSERLIRLMEADILYKELYDESRKRYQYKLTEKGLELYPILIAIAQWGGISGGISGSQTTMVLPWSTFTKTAANSRNQY